MDRIRHDFGPYLVWENLLPVGAMRRNWLQTLLSDGFLVVRHPSLEVTCEMANRIGNEVKLYARAD